MNTYGLPEELAQKALREIHAALVRKHPPPAASMASDGRFASSAREMFKVCVSSAQETWQSTPKTPELAKYSSVASKPGFSELTPQQQDRMKRDEQAFLESVKSRAAARHVQLLKTNRELMGHALEVSGITPETANEIIEHILNN